MVTTKKNSAAKRKTRPVTCRKYKVMLCAERFRGDASDVLAAAECFRGALARSTRKLSGDDAELVSGQFQVLQKSKQATVQFFDTKDRRLRKASLAFRQRQSVQGGALELTLRRRHPDRFFVSGSRSSGKTKMEEDITTTNDLTFFSSYSLSGKITNLPEDARFQKLGDIQAAFRYFKNQLGEDYDGAESVLRVSDFVARQSVLEGVSIRIDEQYSAECALILWYEFGREDNVPLLAEFSFRYDDRTLDEKSEPFSVQVAKIGYDLLQIMHDNSAALAAWINLKGLYKTAYAYSRYRK